MRKFLLSTGLITASTAYVVFGGWQSPAVSPSTLIQPSALLAPAEPVASATASPPSPAIPTTPAGSARAPDRFAQGAALSVRRQGAAPVVLASAPPTTPTATSIAVTSAINDGTYTGTQADAYYGMVQVRAVVSGGKVASVDVLSYPADRSRSRGINSFALPQLQSEVVRAQSASVDVVSGATLTSEAYISSIAAALAQARA
jgi:uncharacterized protein with FMN-binding domain